MDIYLDLALTISAGLTFVYGLFRFFRKDSASGDSITYPRMIVFGLGCAMLGRLYGTLMLLVKGEYYPGFNVGMLGIIGSFLFFFSANFGQVDSVVDDGSANCIKARIIALAAPLSVAALWYAIFSEYGVNELTIWVGIEALALALASYFHLKHLIMKDSGNGMIKSMRSYNLLALVYAVLCLMEVLLDWSYAPIIVCVLECAVLLAFLPVLERGVKKWKT